MPQTILHLGLGSFHRAHQAMYLDRLRTLGDKSWHIAAGNLRADMVSIEQALISQHYLYTLETITPQGLHDYHEISSITDVVPYREDLSGLIEIGARSDTPIISFTVTEAGYYLDDQHNLDLRHADLRSDLSGKTRCTIYGAIAAILAERMKRGAAAVTLMNCDNLRGNGERFHGGFMQFLERRGDTALLAWAEHNTTAPNAMVDRITPRPRAEVAQRVLAATGRVDRAAVMGESFCQWVIEDRFASTRPALERVGVQFVESVEPFEEAKIRILNASHSCIAWAGTLIGLDYIHEGTRIPAIAAMAHDYVTLDVMPCLAKVSKKHGIDLGAYRDSVLDRFSSPYLLDTNQRVAMDGFSKIPGFIAPTIRERFAAKAAFDDTAMLVALFYRFLQMWAGGQLSYQYQDQAMDPSATHAMLQSPDPIASFCANQALWGSLAGEAKLARAVRDALPKIDQFVAAHGKS